MKGNVMFAILFFCSLVLCVVTGFVYFKLENKDFAQASGAVEDVRGSVMAVEELQKTTLNQQKNFQQNTVSALEQLGKRIDVLENDPRDINFNIKEPIKFQVVYREATKKIPEAPTSVKKSKTPLLDRAGRIDWTHTNGLNGE